MQFSIFFLTTLFHASCMSATRDRILSWTGPFSLIIFKRSSDARSNFATCGLRISRPSLISYVMKNIFFVYMQLLTKRNSRKYMGQGIQEWTKQNLWMTAFKIRSDMVSLGRPYNFNFLQAAFHKFYSFLNTLTHISHYKPNYSGSNWD